MISLERFEKDGVIIKDARELSKVGNLEKVNEFSGDSISPL